MDNFFQGIEMPDLSERDRANMDAPVTLEELPQAVAEMASQKSPGLHGLPKEI